MPFHEAQVGQNVLQLSVGLEHQEVIGDMDIKIIKYFQGIENMVKGALAI